MPLPSVITISQVESSVNVAENDGSTQLCVNITHGNVESTASFFYSTNSGTATGMFYYDTFIPPPLLSLIHLYLPLRIDQIASESLHACTAFGMLN